MYFKSRANIASANNERKKIRYQQIISVFMN